MTRSADTSDGETAARRSLMGLIARASHAEIAGGLAKLENLPEFEDVRRPEIGLVMLRGRIAGTGAAFNLGEATVTRAAVRLTTGELGFSYVLGRDRDKARLAALVDALWLLADRRRDVEACIAAPLRALFGERDRTAAAHTAATRVDFFTMVRGEDPAP